MNKEIKTIIENICARDPFRLSPETLYNNIKNSLETGDVNRVAEIYDVPVILCTMIKNECKKQSDTSRQT